MRVTPIVIAMAVCAAIAGVSALQSAQALPPVVATTHSTLTLKQRGEAAMRFFGLKVYDIRLWTAGKPHSYAEPFALELVYDLKLKGADIAARSVEEMRKLGYTDETKLARWGALMARVFPDIHAGDTLVGLYLPDKEVQFFTRQKLIEAIPDPEFARAFFDIWLSPKTSEPKLRTRLLGDKPGDSR